MFSRTEQILGKDTMERLIRQRVILFGVGGVGGWCAEALVRSGIIHLTIVDFDEVAVSNINRQVVATSLNVGRKKVEEMRQRLLSINPDADIVALDCRYDNETATSFNFDDYDFVIDAIDSVADKALLILNASRSRATLLSSMGAARKLNPSEVRDAEFWQVKGCPLARALRKRFKSIQQFPAKKFRVVYSDELSSDGGTLAPVVATFGMRLASLLLYRCHQESTSPTT